uniref:60S acidic ribosomal protein P1 n=1 Tax=Glossina austeni TaxID=7395 RepID=A0A1A9UF08_GLOAU
MSTKAELACVYASLILVDDDVAVTALEEVNVKDLITNIGSGVGGAPAAAALPGGEAAPAAEAKKEEKKESEPEESDDDLGSALFE